MAWLILPFLITACQVPAVPDNGNNLKHEKSQIYKSQRKLENRAVPGKIKPVKLQCRRYQIDQQANYQDILKEPEQPPDLLPHKFINYRKNNIIICPLCIAASQRNNPYIGNLRQLIRPYQGIIKYVSGYNLQDECHKQQNKPAHRHVNLYKIHDSLKAFLPYVHSEYLSLIFQILYLMIQFHIPIFYHILVVQIIVLRILHERIQVRFNNR